MANDNLLAGLAGLLSGVKESLVPAIQARQKYSLETALQDRRLKAEQAMKSQEQGNKFFMDTQLANKDIQAKSDLERQKDLVPIVPGFEKYFPGQEKADKTILGDLIRKSETEGGAKRARMEKRLDDLQKDIDQNFETQAALEDLTAKWNAVGSNVVSGGARFFQKHTPDFINPSRTEYEGQRKSLTPRFTLSMTKSRQGLVSLSRSEGELIPTWDTNKKTGSNNLKVAAKYLSSSRKDLYARKIKLGGELDDREKSDLQRIDKIMSESGGSSSLGGMSDLGTERPSSVNDYLKKLPPGSEFLGYEDAR